MKTAFWNTRFCALLLHEEDTMQVEGIKSIPPHIPGPSPLAADHTHLLLTPLAEEGEMKTGLSCICAASTKRGFLLPIYKRIPLIFMELPN